MGILQKDRSRIHVRGLGNLWLLQKEPTLDTAFYTPGYLKNTTLTDTQEQEEIQPETGHAIDRLTRTRTVMIETNLEQSSIDEINLLKNADGKVYAARYYGLTYTGRFQYHCAEQAKIAPGLVLPFVPGERLLPMKLQALGQDLTYEVPEYYSIETNGLILIEGLQLWTPPRIGLNVGTNKLLDISGWARHGTIGTSYANVWQTNTYPTLPDRFHRYNNATNEYTDFGNITALNDDASGDFMVECWCKFPTAGAQEEVIAKKSLTSDNSAGWVLHKVAGNGMALKIASGSANATATSTATVLTTWKHVAATVDRNGNIQMYINGVADGTPVSVAAIGTGTNSQSLYFGKDGTNVGQVDLGDVRIYRWAAGGLPASIATTIATHYAAERALYGV